MSFLHRPDDRPIESHCLQALFNPMQNVVSLELIWKAKILRHPACWLEPSPKSTWQPSFTELGYRSERLMCSLLCLCYMGYEKKLSSWPIHGLRWLKDSRVDQQVTSSLQELICGERCSTPTTRTEAAIQPVEKRALELKGVPGLHRNVSACPQLFAWPCACGEVDIRGS